MGQNSQRGQDIAITVYSRNSHKRPMFAQILFLTCNRLIKTKTIQETHVIQCLYIIFQSEISRFYNSIQLYCLHMFCFVLARSCFQYLYTFHENPPKCHAFIMTHGGIYRTVSQGIPIALFAYRACELARSRDHVALIQETNNHLA